MATECAGATQLALFDDPILWWPGRPPEPRSLEERSAGRTPDSTAPVTHEQVPLFCLQERASIRGGLRHRLQSDGTSHSYLQLASALGLVPLQRILDVPATYHLLDAAPLRDALGVRTLLEARDRILVRLYDAFADVADLLPRNARMCSFSLWGSRRLEVSGSSSPRGEALCLAIASSDARVEGPFRLRLRGMPGYLGHLRGPSPLSEDEELLALYHRQTLFRVAPLEAQPIALDALLLG